MIRRVFGSQLAVAALSVAGGVLGEASVSGAVATRDSLGASAQTGWWTLGLWALPATLAAFGVAWALAVVCGDDSLVQTLRDAWSRPARRDALTVGMFAAPALLGWVFVVARAGVRFHNLELSAALTAVLVLGGTALLGLAAWLGWGALGARRGAGARLAALPPLALGFELAVVSWLVWACRDGLRQLDPRLLAAPVGALAAFTWADSAGFVRARVRWVSLACAGLALLALLGFLLAGQRAVGALAKHGAWSRPLIGAVQQLTDFRHDGYSGVFGAPKPTEPRRPTWGASAHGSLSNLDVVVVTIETLRRDHASFIRAENDTTPNLRKLAAESLVFERMYSAAPLTRLSIASLFSSYAPSEIDWQAQPAEKRMRRLGPKTPWLPELLSARGYETIAVLTDFSAFTPEEDAGFERGFRHYDVTTALQYKGGTMWGFPAAEQVDKALGYVERAQRPFMLWLHLFEPHFRYEQPPDAPVFGTDERSRYDAEIWHADRQLGRLVEGLRKLGAWDRTVLLVTGDHGEAFGEHADRWHGSNLHDPQLRPAALLRIPGATGKRVNLATTFTDLAPTLARVLGDRQTFEQLRGRSLAPLLHHDRLPEGQDDFVAESFSVDDGHAYQAALVSYPLKLIYVEAGKSFSLYDLATDPNEQGPLDPTSDPRGAPLLAALVGYLERTRPAR